MTLTKEMYEEIVKGSILYFIKKLIEYDLFEKSEFNFIDSPDVLYGNTECIVSCSFPDCRKEINLSLATHPEIFHFVNGMRCAWEIHEHCYSGITTERL